MTKAKTDAKPSTKAKTDAKPSTQVEVMVLRNFVQGEKQRYAKGKCNMLRSDAEMIVAADAERGTETIVVFGD